MKLGSKIRGLDGNMWIVHETIKGTKRWVRILKPIKKYSGSFNWFKNPNPSLGSFNCFKEPSDGLGFLNQLKSIQVLRVSQLKSQLKKQFELEATYGMEVIKNFDWKRWTTDLENQGIIFIIVPLPKSDSGYFFMDYVWSYTKRELNLDDKARNIVMMVVKLENGKLFTEPDILVSFQHVLTKQNSNLVYDIFDKYLKNHLVWNKSPRKAIIIN